MFADLKCGATSGTHRDQSVASAPVTCQCKSARSADLMKVASDTPTRTGAEQRYARPAFADLVRTEAPPTRHSSVCVMFLFAHLTPQRAKPTAPHKQAHLRSNLAQQHADGLVVPSRNWRCTVRSCPGQSRDATASVEDMTAMTLLQSLLGTIFLHASCAQTCEPWLLTEVKNCTSRMDSRVLPRKCKGVDAPGLRACSPPRACAPLCAFHRRSPRPCEVGSLSPFLVHNGKQALHSQIGLVIQNPRLTPPSASNRAAHCAAQASLVLVRSGASVSLPPKKPSSL